MRASLLLFVGYWLQDVLYLDTTRVLLVEVSGRKPSLSNYLSSFNIEQIYSV